jgi:predicted  nucleic acid-binding Zn-ribbon protein
MNATLDHLVLLQAIDLELRHARAELAESPRRVARAEAALKQAQDALAAAQKSLATEETLRRSLQSDAADRRSKITRLRKQMDAATSAAQITALEHEITFSEQTIVKLEDDELASMSRTETAETQQANATRLVADTSATLDAERLRASETLTRNTAFVAAHETERTALRATVEESALSIYDRISKGKGTGISEALDHKCSACQMMIRPQRWNDLTGRDFLETIYNCESCGRMLFYDPRRDAPGPWPPGERLTAALAASKLLS